MTTNGSRMSRAHPIKGGSCAIVERFNCQPLFENMSPRITWLNINTNISERKQPVITPTDAVSLGKGFRTKIQRYRSYAQQISKSSDENTLMTRLQSKMSTTHLKKLKTSYS